MLNSEALAEPASASTGRIAPFGKYLLLQRVSVGGMAEIFKALPQNATRIDEIVAIKRILPNIAEDSEFIGMFIDEARIAGQLDHPNICRIYELGRVHDDHYIAMQFLWGRDLLKVLNRHKKAGRFVSPSMAAFVGSKACAALHYAHTKRDEFGHPLNIIHRDVSPQNIIVGYSGQVKLIDFGVARAASQSQRTQAGILKGKFGYMSPEMIRGMPIDHRSDVFAMGICLHELLTSSRLFYGETDFATLELVRDAKVAPPSRKSPIVPPELDAIVLKALAREPDQRFQTAEEMQFALQEFLAHQDPHYGQSDVGLAMRQAFQTEVQRERERLEIFWKMLERGELVRGASVPAHVPDPGHTGERSALPDPLLVAPEQPAPAEDDLQDEQTHIFFSADELDELRELESEERVSARPATLSDMIPPAPAEPLDMRLSGLSEAFDEASARASDSDAGWPAGDMEPGSFAPGARKAGTLPPPARRPATLPPGARAAGTLPPGTHGTGFPPGARAAGTLPPGRHGTGFPPGARGPGSLAPGVQGGIPASARAPGSLPPGSRKPASLLPGRLEAHGSTPPRPPTRRVSTLPPAPFDPVSSGQSGAHADAVHAALQAAPSYEAPAEGPFAERHFHASSPFDPPPPQPSRPSEEQPLGDKPARTGKLLRPTVFALLVATVAASVYLLPRLLDAGTGALAIESVGDSDALVRVDGVVRGNPPLVVEGLAPGVHKVEVEAHGFELAQADVHVTQGQARSVKLTLEKAAPEKVAASEPTPVVNSALEITPLAPPPVKAPERVVPKAPKPKPAAPVLSASDGTEPETEAASATPSPSIAPSTPTTPSATPTASATPSPSPADDGSPTVKEGGSSETQLGESVDEELVAANEGELLISTVPWSHVFIDDEDTGRDTPVRSLRVTAGTHRIGLRTPDDVMHQVDVVVEAGKVVRIIRRF